METDWNTLRIERDGSVATLTLNRPDKLNCFTIEMWRELRELGQGLVSAGGSQPPAQTLRPIPPFTDPARNCSLSALK